MDEKHQPPASTPRPDMSVRRYPAWLRVLLVAVYAGLVYGTATVFYRSRSTPDQRFSHHESSQDAVVLTEEAKKVPLEAHIMSKCPDALDCLQSLILPTMAEISSEIDFTLSYIGTPTDHDDGVACKHGQTECLGNMLELCAADLYPDPKLYLGFTMCMTKEYENIPDRELVSDCALEHGIDFDKLNDCVSREDGAYALDLLRTSFERSANVGATLSCTVRLNDQVRCIRDGGEWKDCDEGSSPKDLIRDVNTLYEEFN